ncbi:hypothetical protein Tco_0541858, partial [Tanacetum coccineum]
MNGTTVRFTEEKGLHHTCSPFIEGDEPRNSCPLSPEGK